MGDVAAAFTEAAEEKDKKLPAIEVLPSPEPIEIKSVPKAGQPDIDENEAEIDKLELCPTEIREDDLPCRENDGHVRKQVQKQMKKHENEAPAQKQEQVKKLEKEEGPAPAPAPASAPPPPPPKAKATPAPTVCSTRKVGVTEFPSDNAAKLKAFAT